MGGREGDRARLSWRIHRSAAHNGHGFNGERREGKRFSRNAGRDDFTEKKKNLVTLHHRESPIFPNDSVPRSLFNLVPWPRCGDPLRYFSIPRIDLQSFHRLRHFFPPSRSTCIDFVRSESSCIHGSFEKPSVKRHLSPERRSGFEGRTAVPT